MLRRLVRFNRLGMFTSSICSICKLSLIGLIGKFFDMFNALDRFIRLDWIKWLDRLDRFNRFSKFNRSHRFNRLDLIDQELFWLPLGPCLQPQLGTERPEVHGGYLPIRPLAERKQSSNRLIDNNQATDCILDCLIDREIWLRNMIDWTTELLIDWGFYQGLSDWFNKGMIDW